MTVEIKRTPEAVAAAKLVLDIGAAIKTVRPDLIPGADWHEHTCEVLTDQLVGAVSALIDVALPDFPRHRKGSLINAIIQYDGDPLSLIEFGVALGRALDREPV